MAQKSTRRSKGIGAGWIATLLGLVVLIGGGFALGLVVGVVSEEPELVGGHFAGRSTEVDWATAPGEAPDPQEPVDADAPHVGAGPSFGREVPESTGVAQRSSGTVGAAARSVSVTADSLPEPHFAIQVGAFGDADSARGVATQLRENGYPVQVLEPASDDRWRVRVGPVQGRDEADRLAVRLKTEEQLPTWVLREQGS